jgi:Tetratricopeptide repeat
MSRVCAWLVLLPLTAAADTAANALQDLYFGEALYYADQGLYFEALERLDAELAQHYRLDEPELDSLQYHIGDAEFSVGDFELNYRMHQRAGRAIKAVLEGNVDESVRNEAAFRLARIHFQKDQLDEALSALDRITGRVPESIRGDVEFLRANIYLGAERSAEAVDILRRLQGDKGLNGFAEYNLGIALLQDGRRDAALQQLAKAGGVSGGDDASLAIRDKSNLVLGTLLLESAQFADAERSLERVRLDGPLSNRALLSAGWADFSAENYERAIVPWSVLAQREPTDAAVQEAKLDLPYAYGKLNVHGRAALLYSEALNSFGEQLEMLDASINSIRDGKFLQALVREEIRKDKDWVIRLRALPDSPETYYLMELMASHDFQTALQNYLDLEDLRAKLTTWQKSFDAFDDMIGLRSRYYAPLLPGVDGEFRELDSRIRLRREQHRLLDQRLQSLLVAPRPEFLATADERAVSERLDELARRLAAGGGNDSQQQRIERLRGVLTWTLETEYHERLTVFYAHLQELQAAIDTMTVQYESFVRVRQAAVHSYQGYDVPIQRLRTRVREALAGVGLLMARQGHMLELVAIDELSMRRRRLETYHDQARYALADSYDRATKAQALTQLERSRVENAEQASAEPQ